jgi:hypothetical protein
VLGLGEAGTTSVGSDDSEVLSERLHVVGVGEGVVAPQRARGHDAAVQQHEGFALPDLEVVDVDAVRVHERTAPIALPDLLDGHGASSES